jgi:hypothetical protein
MSNTFAKFVGSLSAGTLAFGLLLPANIAPSPAEAIELGGGRTFFDSAPRLIRTATTNSSANAPGTYHFTIAHPEDAGVPLKAVTISRPRGLEQLEFDVSDSRAFQGDSFAGGPSIPLASIGGAEDADEVMIVFDEPVQPGSVVTVALSAEANPSFGGVYSFGVTVFPVGENSPGLYLGSRDIRFYSSD